LILARHLDHAFHRLGAGIAEEHVVGKALLAQPRGEPVAVGRLEQVRHVPQPGGLLLQGGDQLRMAMAQRIDRDARGEVEITIAVGGDQPRALAAFEAEIDPGKDGEQMRRAAVGHGDHLRFESSQFESCQGARAFAHATASHPKTKRAAFWGST
jgi:hypothetical protein